MPVEIVRAEPEPAAPIENIVEVEINTTPIAAAEPVKEASSAGSKKRSYQEVSPLSADMPDVEDLLSGKRLHQ